RGDGGAGGERLPARGARPCLGRRHAAHAARWRSGPGPPGPRAARPGVPRDKLPPRDGARERGRGPELRREGAAAERPPAVERRHVRRAARGPGRWPHGPGDLLPARAVLTFPTTPPRAPVRIREAPADEGSHISGPGKESSHDY